MACGDAVCLSVEDTKKVAQYVRKVKETALALKRCTLITWTE